MAGVCDEFLRGPVSNFCPSFVAALLTTSVRVLQMHCSRANTAVSEPLRAIPLGLMEMTLPADSLSGISSTGL